MEDLDLFFDYTLSTCNGSINYSRIDTAFNFQINENCGVYIAESALTVPPVSYQIRDVTCHMWKFHSEMHVINIFQLTIYEIIIYCPTFLIEFDVVLLFFSDFSWP